MPIITTNLDAVKYTPYLIPCIQITVQHQQYSNMNSPAVSSYDLLVLGGA